MTNERESKQTVLTEYIGCTDTVPKGSSLISLRNQSTKSVCKHFSFSR